ncbi:MAG: hypothetical protein QOG23_230 [Blastocatellia bacterium]|jgi:hypothetical protein|nr:hypothetical protein [Blastocatellia bacterium]
MKIIELISSDKAAYYVITLFGAFCMYVFSLTRGFQGAISFLKKFFPGHSEVFYDRLDFFVVILAGSIIGTIFFSPNSALQALAAGFGWVGAVNVLLSPKGP